MVLPLGVCARQMFLRIKILCLLQKCMKPDTPFHRIVVLMTPIGVGHSDLVCERIHELQAALEATLHCCDELIVIEIINCFLQTDHAVLSAKHASVFYIQPLGPHRDQPGKRHVFTGKLCHTED